MGGLPLTSFETILDYLHKTQTQTGLEVVAHLVEKVYSTGIQVTDAVMDGLCISYHLVCPQWNYTIHPRPWCQNTN